MTGTESTSAALARVEQERDELLAALTSANDQRDEALFNAEILRIQLAGVVQFALAWQGQEQPCPHGQPGGKSCGPCSYDRITGTTKPG